MRHWTALIAGPAMLLLQACGGAEQGPAQASAPPPEFGGCRICHKVEPGAHGLGPSLAGLAGQPAGRRIGYDYSPGFEGADFKWDKARLTQFLLDPSGTVPGTKMAFGGLANREQAARVADYVLSLPGD